MSDCTDWWHSVIHGPGSVLFGKRYTRKQSSSENDVEWKDQTSRPFSQGTKIQETSRGKIAGRWRIFLLKIDENTSSKAMEGPLSPLRYRKWLKQQELFLRITHPYGIFRVSYLGFGRHACTRYDGKCLGWMCGSPPWGPSVCSGWGVGRFIFQYQLITNQPPVLGKGFRFPASSFPFATPPHKMPLPTIQTHPLGWVNRFHKNQAR